MSVLCDMAHIVRHLHDMIARISTSQRQTARFLSRRMTSPGLLSTTNTRSKGNAMDTCIVLTIVALSSARNWLTPMRDGIAVSLVVKRMSRRCYLATNI